MENGVLKIIYEKDKDDLIPSKYMNQWIFSMNNIFIQFYEYNLTINILYYINDININYINILFFIFISLFILSIIIKDIIFILIKHNKGEVLFELLVVF